MINSEKLISEYLEYVNDYLTVEVFAEHRNISIEAARILIRLGQIEHLQRLNNLGRSTNVKNQAITALEKAIKECA